MSYYKKRCLYHTFYGNENVPDNLKCYKEFWTKTNHRLFCDPCKIKAIKHRRKGNYGLKHRLNHYNETIICRINCITLYDFQQMSADKISRLGIFGEDYLLLHFKGKKPYG